MTPGEVSVAAFVACSVSAACCTFWIAVEAGPGFLRSDDASLRAPVGNWSMIASACPCSVYANPPTAEMTTTINHRRPNGARQSASLHPVHERIEGVEEQRTHHEGDEHRAHHLQQQDHDGGGEQGESKMP